MVDRHSLTQLSESWAVSPAIYGVEGFVLSADEKSFFRDANPLGFILFGRNCETPAQVRALTDSLRECLGRSIPILIDQEGGRVQRMKAPHWPAYPAAAQLAGDVDNLALVTAQMAGDLTAVGINVNCAPVLDVTFPQTHAAIGDRAYSSDADIVARCGDVVCAAYLANGIVPIVKHMPGLGRADLDTHKDLPAVTACADDLDTIDFLPYKKIMKKSYAPSVWGMVGHAVYEALDPGVPASCSSVIIENIIRQEMGFSGILVSDDLSMDALSQYGGEQERAALVLKAGCDIALHCNGKLDEMKAVANRIPPMAKASLVRYNRGLI